MTLKPTIIEQVYQNYLSKPECIALQDEKVTLTNRQLFTHVYVLAKQLRNSKEAKGNAAVIVTMRRDVSSIIKYLALHLAQIPLIPITDEVPKHQLSNYKMKLERKGFIALPWCDYAPADKFTDEVTSEVKKCLTKVIDCREFPKPDQVSDCMFTSGTTGESKIIILRHKNLMASVQNILLFEPVLSSDIELSFLPLSHSFALTRMRTCLVAGARLRLCR